MPEALPTSLLSALFWATAGVGLVRLRRRASHDQLAMLWLMTVFGFALVGAPIVLNVGWKVGLGLGALAAVVPSIGYRHHFGRSSPEQSERWSIGLYAALLLGSACGVALNAATFTHDLNAISGLSVVLSAAMVLVAVMMVGLTGVFTALVLRTAR